jgi:hypothetical protein
VVLPSGAGGPLVDLETVGRPRRTTLVLSRSTVLSRARRRGGTAVGFEPATGPTAGTHDDSRRLTALTYQSLAARPDEDEADDGQPGVAAPVDPLHPDARALVTRLQQAGELTLVLDDCPRALEAWGPLVQELVDHLPGALVVGLSTTPTSTLTRDQKRLVDDLFGEPVHEVSGLRREQHPAPLADPPRPTPSAPRPRPAGVVLHGEHVLVRDHRLQPWRPHFVLLVAMMLTMLVYLLDMTPVVVIVYGVVTVLGLQTTVAVDRGRRLAEDLQRPPDVERVAYAVADGLLHAGLSPLGSAAVTLAVDDEGVARCALDGVEPSVSAVFATSLGEVVSPMASPWYVVPRWVLQAPIGNAHGLRCAFGRLRPDRQVWHSVPSALGTSDASAQLFARAWDTWVGGGPAVSTGSPEGADVLASHRGSDPFDVTTVLGSRRR